MKLKCKKPNAKGLLAIAIAELRASRRLAKAELRRDESNDGYGPCPIRVYDFNRAVESHQRAVKRTDASGLLGRAGR